MYTVYKITNTINGKYYIGVHKTTNPYDSYIGSGLAIKNAIKKYGKENFYKEILLITECKKEAYLFEHKLTENYIVADSYNMKRGGVGGFTRENALKGNAAALVKLTKQQLSDYGKKGYHAANNNPVECGRKGGLANRGKPKSKEHIQKIKEAWVKKKLLRTSSSVVSS